LRRPGEPTREPGGTMLGKQAESATGGCIGGGALRRCLPGSREPGRGEGGGRSMAEAMERRGPARREGRKIAKRPFPARR
jgi:hypothetical protein